VSELRTVREIGSPFTDDSIDSALDNVYAEVLASRPATPDEAVYYLNLEMWRFALQFAEDLDQVRSDVLEVWNSPNMFPDTGEPKNERNRR
jgi:hypothetical protein